MLWLEYVVGRVVKGPAEEVGGSLTPREDDLFDQYNDEKSARSGFPELVELSTMFNGSTHAFLNPDHGMGNEKAAASAWSLAVNFLRDHLKEAKATL
jgi:dienelactone hydrolase